MNRRKFAAATVTATLVAGGAAALTFTGLPSAIAQSTSGAPSASAERGAWMDDALSGLVSGGTLTQAQADAVREALLAARPEGHGGPGGPGFHVGPAKLDTIAEVIGLTVDELRAAIEGGQTIAEVAEAEGVSVEQVVAALLDDLDEHLAEGVAEGDMTQAEADEILADAPERLTEMVQAMRVTTRRPHGRSGASAPGPRRSVARPGRR